MDNITFEMVAKTFQGLEGVLADELRALGAQDVTEGIRMVSFTGDKRLMYRANFACRTALSILKPFFKFRATDTDDLYAQVRSFDWQQIMEVGQTFAISVTASGDVFRNSQFVTYRVKDGIADYFTERCGKRPSIRVSNPDVRYDVHIAGDEVTISLNSSGEPLYKRGWRVAQNDAPINEVLAAGIIALSGWHGECDLVDPMCGSGTFLVEAALIATNVSPGVFREDYAFKHWRDYDEQLFDEISNDDSGEREFEHKIYGYDIEGKAIAISRANAKSASVLRYIELERRDIADWESAPAGGIIITNPPYGKRLGGDANLQALYATIGTKLKHVFTGYNAWLICPDDRELVRHIGLKSTERFALLNGSLECNLLHYMIFEGKYDELRSRGESVRPARAERDHTAKPYKPRKFNEMRSDGQDGDSERPHRKPGHKPGHKPLHELDRHSEEYARRVLRGRRPRLTEEQAVPLMRDRRRAWKKNDQDDNATGNE